MSILYFDASALVKRYATEVGSPWVKALADPKARNMIFIAEITLAEAAAALAAKSRAPGGLSRSARDRAVGLLLGHSQTEYTLLEVQRFAIERAVQLTQVYRLRGYDAIQLATALLANERLVANHLPHLTFVAADGDLFEAARAEGLDAENPNLHL